MYGKRQRRDVISAIATLHLWLFVTFATFLDLLVYQSS